ncbi:Restriction endonuclease [compost metagenome]
MGSILFDPEILGDSLSETAGYKAGLALSIEEMCDHLVGTRYSDILRASETQVVRLRSEDYDELFYKLLHRIGYTKEEFNGDVTGLGLFHKYRDTKLEHVHAGVQAIFIEIWPKLIQAAIAKGTKILDPTPYIRAAHERFGIEGARLAVERIEVLDAGLRLSPNSGLRYTEWRSVEALETLFKGGIGEVQVGRFIDQRFVNYLMANHDRLSDMHWRKFEELTAEYFHQQGFFVDLGPGSNDDGVDVRVWKQSQDESVDPPHMIIQCKRQKAKVEKVIVKGLHADMQHLNAEYGLIVTTSELSPGAKETIIARGYAISEVDKIGLKDWLKALEKPGSGIVRI